MTHAQNYRTNDTHEQHTRQNKNTKAKNKHKDTNNDSDINMRTKNQKQRRKYDINFLIFKTKNISI